MWPIWKDKRSATGKAPVVDIRWIRSHKRTEVRWKWVGGESEKSGKNDLNGSRDAPEELNFHTVHLNCPPILFVVHFHLPEEPLVVWAALYYLALLSQAHEWSLRLEDWGLRKKKKEERVWREVKFNAFEHRATDEVCRWNLLSGAN